VPKQALNLDRTSARLADFIAEYSTESRLSWVGEKDAPDRARIVRKYSELFTKAQVEAAKTFYESSEGETRERARRLYFALLGMNISEQTVELGDRLDTFLLQATVEVDGEELSFYAAQAAIQHEDDFDRRERLAAATEGVVEESNPLRREMLERELDLIGEWGYAGFTELISEQKGIDYVAFRSKINGLFRQVKPIYDEAMSEWVSATLQHAYPGLHRVHSAYLRGLPTFNRFFPSKKLASVAENALGDLGFRLSDLPNIHVDVEDRPKKNPRAVCFVTRTPEEIHLIIKPTGTQHDYEAFFHEAGHALHFGLTPSDLPFEFRDLSTSHALTEVYSYAIESLVRCPGWLTRYLDVPTETAQEIRRASYLVDLMMFARYVGKLNYELDFFTEPGNDERNQKLYAETLTAHSGFSYDPRSYLGDMDSGLYVADYLRAWLTQAALEEHLVREFGEEWYQSGEVGDFFRGLWARGVSLENEDLARELGYEPWDTTPLRRRYETLRGETA
jgi:hypothetical protein